ncbi:MAG: type II toxin-antitoxin system Phd/YefM family antitoxin [Planctomycetota bacterium]
MATVTIEKAQARIAELIDHLRAGEELTITRSDQPIARLQAEGPIPVMPRAPGSALGTLVVVCEDESHLDDFAEYMR